jgi:hypothetical protein
MQMRTSALYSNRCREMNSAEQKENAARGGIGLKLNLKDS